MTSDEVAIIIETELRKGVHQPLELEVALDLVTLEMADRLGLHWPSDKGHTEHKPQPDENDGYTHRRYLLALILHPREAHVGLQPPEELHVRE